MWVDQLEAFNPSFKKKTTVLLCVPTVYTVSAKLCARPEPVSGVFPHEHSPELCCILIYYYRL